jgi:uncharacterized repeat protein (TIGR03803 family)
MKAECIRFLLMILSFVALSIGSQATDKQTILHKFSGKIDGSEPMTGLIADSSGNFYGTTPYGGGTDATCPTSNKGCGTVFKLSPNSAGGWTETVIHAFGGIDGAYPSGVIFDASGNLYGETARGGLTTAGTIFELSPNSDGTWTEKTLYSFTGTGNGNGDGQEPLGGLAIDASGNLYGTTLYGGVTCINGLTCGTVFEVSPSSDGTWTEMVLHAFVGSDGFWPQSNLVSDAAGNLYGTTTRGGSYDDGVVFSLSPSSSGWAINIVYAFTGRNGDGYGPQSGVVFDSKGNLYGTTQFGINTYGIVYELTPASGFPWTETLLHTFLNGTDGSWPVASVVVNREGTVYGTTQGYLAYGNAFRLVNSSSGWQLTVLHTIPGIAGPLLLGTKGALYGTTTASGGIYGINGGAFELSPVK